MQDQNTTKTDRTEQEVAAMLAQLTPEDIAKVRAVLDLFTGKKIGGAPLTEEEKQERRELIADHIHVFSEEARQILTGEARP